MAQTIQTEIDISTSSAIQALDDFAAAMRKATGDMSDLDKGTKKTEKGTKSFGGVLSGLKQGFGVAIGALGALGLATSIKGLGETVLKQIDINDMLQDSLVGFGESASDSKREVDSLRKLSVDLGGDLEGLAKQVLTFKSAGFDYDSAERLTKTVADLATIFPKINADADGFSQSLAKVALKGEVTDATFEQFAKYGLRTDQIFASVAKRIGKTTEQTEKLAKAGKLDPEQFIAGIRDLSLLLTKGHQEGDAAISDADENVGKLTQRIKNRFDNLFSGDDMAQPIIDVFKKIDEVSAKAFAKDGPVVAGFAAIRDGLAWFSDHQKGVTAAFVGIASAIGVYQLSVAAAGIASAIAEVPIGALIATVAVAAAPFVLLGAAIAAAVYWFDPITDWIAQVIKDFVEFGDIVGPKFVAFWDDTVAFFKGLPGQFVEFGSMMIDGLVKGITDEVDSAVKAVTGVVDAVTGTVKSVLGIHSPSAVFAGFGEQSAEGYAQGMEGSAGRVEQATSDTVTPSGMGSSASSTSVAPVFNLTINAPGGDAQSIASFTVEQLRLMVGQVFSERSMMTA